MEKNSWPKLDISQASSEILARVFHAIFVFSARTVYVPSTSPYRTPLPFREEIAAATARMASFNPKPRVAGMNLDEYIQIGKKVFPERLNLTEVEYGKFLVNCRLTGKIDDPQSSWQGTPQRHNRISSDCYRECN